MSFRIEKKIAINKRNFFFLKKFLVKNNFKKIYKDRSIFSCYLDNNHFKMYNDSIEGIVPRKKLRLRSYNELLSGDIFFEKKISSIEGRFKTSEKINNFNQILFKGYFDKDYGICYPKIIVKYVRTYYKKKNLRLTIDKKILFSNYNRNFKSVFFYSFDDYDCAEIKCDNLGEIENLKLNHFLETRNSKYCIGIDHILRSSNLYTEPF